MIKIYFSFTLLFMLFSSCNGRLSRIKKTNATILISNANSKKSNSNIDASNSVPLSKSFTFIDKDGKELIFNETVKDETTGEAMSVRHLNEVFVTAKSHNISERNGIISLDFIVTVPELMQKSTWQVDLLPVLSRGSDTIHFKRILITGNQFKKSQDKSYKKYEKYIRSIIPDDINFFEAYTDIQSLSIFLERNLPQSKVISGIKNDTLETDFGVKEQNIVDHYVKKWLIERNQRRKNALNKKFSKYIKNPYLLDTRLDSIVKGNSGSFEYHYTQNILANENSSKLALNIHGQIRDIYGKKVDLCRSDSLIYNVSSLINLIDCAIKYKRVVIEKKVTLSSTFSIEFNVNQTHIDLDLAQNKREMQKLKQKLYEVIENERFCLDSIIIEAASSPDGPLVTNQKLANLRSISVKKLCRDYLAEIQNEKKVIELGDKDSLFNDKHHKNINQLIKTSSISENWTYLKELINSDLKIKERNLVLSCFNIKELDLREKAIKQLNKDSYYIIENLYPKLRKVDLNFFLKRKGMVKDTIHTNEIDTIYAKGIQLLKLRKYKEALIYLKDYSDYNTALIYASLGHNLSAKIILENLPKDAFVLYVLSIIEARVGNETSAITNFIKAKEINRAMAHRGELDPEISFIIRKYNLNKDLFE